MPIKQKDQSEAFPFPSIEELMRAQGVRLVEDPRELGGDFWPEEESLDDFLAALREWRGRSGPNDKPI